MKTKKYIISFHARGLTPKQSDKLCEAFAKYINATKQGIAKVAANG